MIVSSIDVLGGRTVQLIGGEELALEAGDPRALARRFRVAGEIAVVDLDAARGEGSNRAAIEELCRLADCRVGGGIRDLETARSWLDAGASQIVIGTAAESELLRALPPRRVIVALDARDGEVVVDGWRRGTGRGVLERMAELRGRCGGFLVTFVEREGRLGGTDLDRVEELVRAAAPARVAIAGGVTTAEEVAALDRMGADAQVGMALYAGELGLAEGLAAPLTSDRPDGLWPTVVVDEAGVALGLAWSDLASLREAVKTGSGVYHSRRRGLWRKGESSGATQELVRVELDCDRDALRFTVRQRGDGFCHRGTRTCWGEDRGLARLARRLTRRFTRAPAGSYTRRLFDDPELLASKLVEEAGELGEAATAGEVCREAADVLYFTLVRAAAAGVELGAIEAELDRRERRVTRRGGDAKEPQP